jgi:Recombination endonuclease VII
MAKKKDTRTADERQEARRERGRRYYRKNREKVLAKNAEWEKNNPRDRKKEAKVYRDKNHKKLKVSQKKWREENSDRINDKCREKYKANPSKIPEFNKNAEAKRKWAWRNPEKYAEIMIAVQFRRRLRKYGMTVDEYRCMLASQDGCCAICRSATSDLRRNGQGGKRRIEHGWPSVAGKGDHLGFIVDHDHKTGKVRGLLCHPCNAGIGLLKDNPELLVAAANYLMKSKETGE